MCLIIKRSSVAKIATRNKVCYKLVKKYKGEEEDGKPVYQAGFFSHFYYYEGVLYETEIKESIDTACFDDIAALAYDLYGANSRAAVMAQNDLMSLGAGFHSAKSVKRLVGEDGVESKYSIALCCIPAGATYYEDKTGLMVSNRIIVKRIIIL